MSLNKLRIKSELKSIVLSIFIILFAGSIAGLIIPLHALALPSQQNIRVAVEIKEFLMLEVFTPSGRHMSSGPSGAQVTTVFRMEDNPVHIRVLLSVPRNQLVQLRVQAHGDLINSRGETFPISHVAWQASGQGFRNGFLTKDSSQIMAGWTGPGMYQGAINYYYAESPALLGDYRQTITYSLVIP